MKKLFLHAAVLCILLLPGKSWGQIVPPEPAPPGHGLWQLEFGPLLGSYQFDALTSFEDGPLFGARLAARRSRWFQLEAEFTEVYTRREITGHSARQMSVALHGRFRFPRGRWDPSALLGLAFVGLDDSEDIDSFGDAWDLGLALGYRVSPRWVVRGEWMLRYQRFTVFDPNLSPEMQDDDMVGTWARSWLVGAHYSFPGVSDAPSSARESRTAAAGAAGTGTAYLAGAGTEAPAFHENATEGRALHLGGHFVESVAEPNPFSSKR